MFEMSADQNYRTVLTDADVDAMNQRTQTRRQAAIAALGAKWLGYTQRRAVPVNVASIKQRNGATK